MIAPHPFYGCVSSAVNFSSGNWSCGQVSSGTFPIINGNASDGMGAYVNVVGSSAGGGLYPTWTEAVSTADTICSEHIACNGLKYDTGVNGALVTGP